MSGALKGSGVSDMSKNPEWEDEDGDAEVSPLVVEAVGKALHAHFQSIAEMPLPDRLLVLLAELEARERRQDN